MNMGLEGEKKIIPEVSSRSVAATALAHTEAEKIQATDRSSFIGERMERTEGGAGKLLRPWSQRSAAEAATAKSYSSPTVMASSLKAPSASSANSLAFRALQALPVPLLVLSRQKTVVLANGAVGKLFSVPENSDANVTEALGGKSLNDLGVDVVEKDSPLWVSWDVVLDSVVGDAKGSRWGKRHHPKVTVLIPPLDAQPKWPNDKAVRATMIVTPFHGEEGEFFFTLAFAPAEESQVGDCCGAEDVGYANTLVGSSDTASSVPAPTLQSKISMLKEALIDAMELPVFAMWEDGSVVVPNRSVAALLNPPEGPVDDAKNAEAEKRPEFDRNNFVNNFRMFTEDFKRELDVTEYPIMKPCRQREGFDSIRVGVLSKDGEKKVYDAGGKCLRDKNGEFLAGLTWLRDRTEMSEIQRKLDAEGLQNEARFRNICDCMPQMIWATTTDGLYDYFSKRWYDYTGLSPDYCIGPEQGWKDGYHADDLETIEQQWQHCLSTGEDFAVEYRCRRYDGEYRWMLGRALPLRDSGSGEIMRWYGTMTDIDDMVEARTAESSTREQLLEALGHGKLTLWAVDAQRKFTLIQGQGIRWASAQSRAELIKKSLAGGIAWSERTDPELYYGRDIDEVLEKIDPDDSYHTKFTEPIEPLLRGETSEGSSETEMGNQWYKTKYVPVRGKKGPGGQFDPNYVTGVIGLSMDVTQMHAAEIELSERESQNRILQANESAAKEASKLKSEFLASMSHEIRTPIAGVVGMCDILLDTELSSEQREFAEGIQRSANALLTVINDILDISKVESGRMDIEEVQFNLSLVIRDVVKMLSFDAERKSLRFEHEIDFPGTGDMAVMGDPGRVRQILMNLLTNAVKFTQEGYVNLSTSVASEDDDILAIHFVVRDTGIGISEEDQKKLFQPFTQADSSTARRFGGTGLGLTICRNLVTLMGGSIGLDSEAGRGTTAGFTIPFKKPRRRLSNFEIDLIPERLQSDMSVSCRSSDNGNGTPPDSPPDTNVPGSDVSRSHSLLKLLGRTSLLGVDSDLLSNFEERKKRHVLVVEDNEINQQIAIRLIKKLNFTVSAVKNGIEALDFVQKCTELPATTDDSSNLPPAHRRPDVILMDVQMPELDGYSATRAIRSGKLSHTDLAPRSHPSTSMRALSPPALRPTSPRETVRARNVQDWLISVPIVAMTASAIKGDKEKCREAGMDDYLAKPVRGGMLEKMLVKWCSSAVSSSRTNSAAGDDLVSPEDDGPSPPALSAIASSSASPFPDLPRTQNGSSATGMSAYAGPPDRNSRKIKVAGTLIDTHGQVGREGLGDLEEIIRSQDRSVLIRNDTQDTSDRAERAENKLGSDSPPMLTANEGNRQQQQQQDTKEDQKKTPTYLGNV